MIRYAFMSLSLLLVACSAPTDIRDNRFIMGTLVEFTVNGVDETLAANAISAAASEMQRIEDAFTIYGEHDNSVKRFNRVPVGMLVTLPDEVERLLELSLQIKRESHDAFDPALGKLNLLWGFSQPEAPTTPPSKSKIGAAIPPQKCVEKREKGWVRLDERCMLDFGAIAKGYAIDRGIETLRSHGIENAVINGGGDIRLIGRHGDRPWRIGIRHPRHKGEVVKSLELEGDVAVVTSGDYERFFIHSGTRYHHILDPSSGMPATGIQSATIIAESAAIADAWSTALFIQNRPNHQPYNFNFKSLLIDNKGKFVINTL